MFADLRAVRATVPSGVRQVSQPLRIFAGGLGRSGTTLITELLGRHHQIAGLAWETRFIVDADGLGELVWALSRDWAGPSTAGMKVQAFRQMMMHDLLEPEQHPYLSYDMLAHFERDHYWSTIGAFLRRVIRAEWCATGLSANRSFRVDAPVGHRHLTVTVTDAAPTRILPNVFAFEEIRALAAQLVDALFGDYARRLGRSSWVEKTPHNILSPFPRLLFPDCYVLHIVRDPRDVAVSIADGHSWGPESIRDAIDWVAAFYERWLVLRPDYLEDERYIEMRYEALVAEPCAELQKLCARLGLEFDPAMLANLPHASAVGRYATGMSDDDRAYLESNVAELAARAGLAEFQ